MKVKFFNEIKRRCVIPINLFCAVILFLLWTPFGVEDEIYASSAKIPITEQKATASLSSSLKLSKKSILIGNDLRYYFISKNFPENFRPLDVLFFLHGLENNGEVSEETLAMFEEINKRACALKCLAVFPVGLPKTFSGKKETLAWSPDTKSDNFNYLIQLRNEIRKLAKVKTVFLAGYSNAAFFICEILQQGEEAYFDGYWMQGGGYRQNIHQPCTPHKVVIEISKQDAWHYEKVKTLYHHLLASCWKPGHQLIYRELEGDHAMNLQLFEENILFLRKK